MSAMRSWTPLAWAGTVVLALALAACAQPPAQLLDWRPVEVTGVSALGVAPDAVIVGLAADAAKGQAPRVLVFRAGLSSPVEVRPTTGYGAEASWLGFASGPDGLVAVGGARGGAHSNVRWSVWGSLTSSRSASSPSTSSPSTSSGAGNGSWTFGTVAEPVEAPSPTAGSAATSSNLTLVEQPQPFETFGGWGAGALVGITSGPEGPVIAGSWAGAVGLDIALWTPASPATWTRLPASPDLRSTPQLLRKAAGIAATASGLVLVGDEIDLTGEASQTPAAWVARGASGPWTRVALPGGPGRAEAIGCGPSDCLIAGVGADGHARAWRLSGVAASELALPTIGVPEGAKVPSPTTGQLAFPTASGGVLLNVAGAGVRQQTAPPGTPTALVERNGSIYLATTDAAVTTLWTANVAA
ncbi:hypothetical protein [Propioniciclava tarda]|uniref:Uncharacterized protein n=1 Tax=Propioniciclava tarda TaxID=433330 RepID=A0A4Q9KMP7_PROTD|nr:hypothetical protein [Propioniciclava tarda]TBT95029.1 hypothetical protein ET996_07080 [Propioniciclava tarda]SMO54149.1 hypothetical protein SAMN06266982_10622 [Propioniciclava tarda]